ncbi:hypothetical protein [Pseudomonas fluorescens]|uniref:hypothetical protein n=1 Tax=Pseudomonas fluorescens TaxID=294 RepID=UPI0012D81A3F|nr:hypothetical protein [Pseudomonas fluorescens]
MNLRSRLFAQAAAQVVSELNPYQAHRLLHAHLEPLGSTSSPSKSFEALFLPLKTITVHCRSGLAREGVVPVAMIVG